MRVAKRGPSIAIVGAGMGGIAMAAMLEQMGVKYDVYDQTDQFGRVGAGIHLSPNVSKVFRPLGIEAMLKDLAFRPRSWINRVGDTGEVTFDHPLGDHIEARFGAATLLMHRADLHRTLMSLVPAENIRLGKRLAGLEPRGPGVKLEFADGTSVNADAVIGADGVHSKVRETLLGPDKPKYTGVVAYRSVFNISRLKGLKVTDDHAKWWGKDRHIVIYFVSRSRDEIYFVTGVPEVDWRQESWSTRGDRNELCAHFENFHPTVRQVVAACPEVAKWAILEREPLPRWSNGAVTLLGDASHAMMPHLAQGAAMAFEDAAVLARSLREVGVDDFERTFSVYELNRKARCTRVQHASHANVFMRAPTNTDWLYSYDAWTDPLALHAPSDI
jgi:salicylate hydroxylase/6-hydroxynicotinate 3-monooxygenase